MTSTRSTVRKVTVVTSTSRHGTRRPHRDHCHPGQPHPEYGTGTGQVARTSQLSYCLADSSVAIELVVVIK